MWGRELRAGLVFVLVSLLAGGAVRAWQREHRERFADLVAALEEYDAAAPRAQPHGVTPEDGDPAAPAARGGAAAGPGGRARSAPEPLRPASLDVDRASAPELERLPGIGPALAARIVAERASGGPFGGPDGLLRVSGIGPKTLAKLRPYLAAGRASPARSDTARAK